MLSMTFGSLFSGIGGMDLGLERAGLECRWQVEIDPFCRKVLEKHWPTVKRYGDIKGVDGGELERVDLLAGGFPCQDLSYAGKRAGIEGSRSGLWFEFARLIGELRPRYVLIENVPGLLVYDGLRRVIGELARLGYVGCWRCLRASEFGASHLRKRVFIVAHSLRGGSSPFEDHKPHQRARPDDSVSTSGRQLADASQGAGSRIDTSSGDRREDSSGRSGQLADRPSRGRRELRESPRSGGQFDGRGEVLVSAMGDAARDEQRGRERESGRLRRGRVWETGESMDDSPSSRQARPQERGIDSQGTREQQGGSAELERGCVPVADARSRQLSEPRRGSEGRDGPGSAGAVLPDELDHTERTRLEERNGQREQHPQQNTEPFPAGLPFGLTFAPGPNDPRWPAILRERPDLAPALESPVRGVAHGLPDWMVEAMSQRTKRLSKLGNAVVPQIAEWIGRRINEVA